MDNTPIFHTIDTSTWPMAQQFYYYTQMAPTTYTVNVTIDVTVLRGTLKKAGYKFFPAYLYAVTKAVSKQRELKMAIKDGVLGYWENLTPIYPQFHEDDGTTSLLFSEYKESFKEFYNGYIEDTKRYGNDHGILTSKGIPLPNSYVISCIPWFTFDSFSLHNHGLKDYFVPSFEAGAFIENNGRVLMPLSITVHHATTDGHHLKLFFDELNSLFNNPDGWLD